MFWNNVLQVAIEDCNDIIRRRSWFPTFGPISHILPGPHLLRCCPVYTRAHFSDTVVAPYQVGFSEISPNSVALKISTTVTLRWYLTIQWHCNGILPYSDTVMASYHTVQWPGLKRVAPQIMLPKNGARRCCQKIWPIMILPKNAAQ